MTPRACTRPHARPVAAFSGTPICEQEISELHWVNKGRLQPQYLATGLAEEHVAVAEQVLGAALVDHDLRVDLRRHLERGACGQIGLQGASHPLGAWALRGQHKVDSRGAR